MRCAVPGMEATGPETTNLGRGEAAKRLSLAVQSHPRSVPTRNTNAART
jgi:hypothetical protein